MKNTEKNNRSIKSIEDLLQEQRKIKAVIRSQEKELRQRVQKVPGELFYAGANAVIPTMLSGKITSSILNTGKEFINHAFSKKEGEPENGKLMAAVKQVGIFTALRLAYRAFIQRK